MIPIYFLLSCVSLLFLYLSSDRAIAHLSFSTPFTTIPSKLKKQIGIVTYTFITILLMVEQGILKGLVTSSWWFFLIAACYILLLPTKYFISAPILLFITAFLLIIF